MNVFYKILRMIFVLCLGLGIITPSLHGVVLCINGSGHVAIEVAHQKCCQDHAEPDNTAKHSSAAALIATANHGCYDCIDLPLSGDFTSILIKNIDCHSLLKISLQYSVDDISSVMNHSDAKATQPLLGYDYPPAPLLSLIIQSTTVLRV